MKPKIILSETGDVFTGSSANEHIIGKTGDDVIHSGGGTDYLSGNGGDDVLILQNGGGASGGSGNDILFGEKNAKTTQRHMGGDDGDDMIIMSMKVKAGWNHKMHHVYGGDGKDTFEFCNVAQAERTTYTLIDDFDPSQDTIVYDGEIVDVFSPPENVEVVLYQGKQHLLIDNKHLVGIEGARYMPDDAPVHGHHGEEMHFHKMPADFSSLERIDYHDSINFVPIEEYQSDLSGMNILEKDENSTLMGSDDADYFYGGHENNGTADNNEVSGGNGNDVINGGAGEDYLRGGGGDDLLAGGIDKDILVGGGGYDKLWGGSQDDVLRGKGQGDYLNGGSGNDRLLGGNGRDVLVGGTGADQLAGGNGGDQFVFADDDLNTQLLGSESKKKIIRVSDTIKDFGTGNDVIVFDSDDVTSIDDISVSEFTYQDNKYFHITTDAGGSILVDVTDDMEMSEFLVNSNFDFA